MDSGTGTCSFSNFDIRVPKTFRFLTKIELSRSEEPLFTPNLIFTMSDLTNKTNMSVSTSLYRRESQVAEKKEEDHVSEESQESGEEREEEERSEEEEPPLPEPPYIK